MISLSTTDYSVFAAYLAAIVGLSILFRAKRFSHMFGEDRKPSWVLLAASLLMIEWSPMTDMMSMGLILENGYSGIWMLKSRFWLAGVPAILYATMWSRLKFQTDNELIRLRFSGKSAVFLHVFRAIFLAIFVIPLFGSFIILALSKLLDIVQLGPFLNPQTVLVAGVLLLVLKNSFHQKIRTDLLNAAVCLAAPILVCFFLLRAHGGFENIYSTLKLTAGNEIQLIPMINDPKSSSSFANFFVFVFVSTIWDCGLLEYKVNNFTHIDKEAFYLQVALQHLPDGFKAVVLIAILFSFITTLESIINWGGGLLTVDIIKTYVLKDEKDRQYRYLSFMAMLLVSTLSLLFAFQSDKIITLQKFIFSISAGVAPVFLLRWFWWRINAWTQISAMLSSLMYTLIYDYFHQSSSSFKALLEMTGSAIGLSPYPLKLVILTMLVVATWLTVMYCTNPDDKEHLKRFVARTGAGGLWPDDFSPANYQMSKRLSLCLIFAVTYMLPFFFIWQFKFGYPAVAASLLVIFGVLVVFVYRSMLVLLGGENSV